MSEEGGVEPTRVLLVEDEDMNRILIRAILLRSTDARLRDLEIIEARTLKAARAALAQASVDIILLDSRLPDGSGLDLARELTADPAISGPWIIGCSASVLPEQQAAALAAGCDALLGKPFHPEELRVMLLAALTREGIASGDENETEGVLVGADEEKSDENESSDPAEVGPAPAS